MHCQLFCLEYRTRKRCVSPALRRWKFVGLSRIGINKQTTTTTDCSKKIKKDYLNLSLLFQEAQIVTQQEV